MMGLFRRKKEAPKRTATRSYAGAQTTARLNDFTPSYLSADAELEVALAILRGRARNLERNNPLAKRFLQLMQDNVVGHVGFQLQLRAKNLDGSLDTVANERIEAAWREWTGTVTADGMMDWVEASRMAVRVWGRDGEAFVHIRRGRQFPDGIALKFIEADQIDETLNSRFPGTQNRIRMGVEIDEDERPIAYHMHSMHPGDHGWFSGINQRKYVRVPASDMIHMYIKSRPGQTRGEPPMSAVLTDAKMLAGYRDAEITNRRLAAAKGGFFERDKDSGPVEGVADSETDDGQLEMEVRPGMMTALPEGYRYTPMDPNGSSTDYVGFERQIIRSIATGLGVSYFDLAMDLEAVSYSSIRQGALSDRDFYRAIQRFFISRFAMRVYREWLSMVLDFGNTGLPPRRFAKFSAVEAVKFRPRGWSWVDPSKEVKAYADSVALGITSRRRIAGEQGNDLDDIAQELAEEEPRFPDQSTPVATEDDE